MDKKKVLVWCIIILVLFFIPAIFVKQFLELDTFVKIPTINFGTITMPGLIAGGLGFWGMALIVIGIIVGIKNGIISIKKCIKKRTAS